ncbi:Subtilisin-like protease SBT3.3 [Capsicum annuum]|nr:Subtilisin-like protease SBT3.3 [Capsicum annuum]
MFTEEKHKANEEEKRDVFIMLQRRVWPESEAFNDKDLGPIPSKWKGHCQSSADFDPAKACNRKLIGAKYFLKGLEAEVGRPIIKDPSFLQNEFASPRDENSHGTHTSSTAGGSFAPNASYHGLAYGTVRGGAPKARIAMYKVCWNWPTSGGCDFADIIKAIDEAIHDGVDILSLSLGTNTPQYADVDMRSVGFPTFHAVMNGITVVCSGGNDGPIPQTVEDTSPWLITVAASTIDRSFPTLITLGNNRTFAGQSLYTGKETGFISIVHPENTDFEDSRYCETLNTNDTWAAGKVVLCFLVKGHETELGTAQLVVQAVGGLGLIVAKNPTSALDYYASDFPGIEVSSDIGAQLLDYIRYSRNPQVKLSPTRTHVEKPVSTHIASFSSRGPNSVAPAILKPDITAPGVNILAAVPPGETPYRFNSGTSMAAPHISGIVALLKSLHPHWSPAAIKSALVTTAWQKDPHSGEPIIAEENTDKIADPFDFGGGLVNANGAKDPGLVYDMESSDYVLYYLCPMGYNTSAINSIINGCVACPIKMPSILDLNLPSITLPSLKKTVTVSRTVTNVGSVSSKYRAIIEPPLGITIKVKPETLIFNSSTKKVSFTLTISTTHKYTTGYYFGSLTWTDRVHRRPNPLTCAMGDHNTRMQELRKEVDKLKGSMEGIVHSMAEMQIAMDEKVARAVDEIKKLFTGNGVQHRNGMPGNGEQWGHGIPVDLMGNSEKPRSTAQEGHKNGGYQLPTRGYQSNSPNLMVRGYGIGFTKLFDDPMEDFKDLKQTGTVQEYIDLFDELLTRVELSKDYVVSCFIRGLKPKIGLPVKILGPRTLAKAMSLAKIQEQTLMVQRQAFSSDTSEIAALTLDGIIQRLGKVILSIGLGKANIVLCLKTVDLEVSDSLGGHRTKVIFGNMSSITGDYCDYDMGDYDCSDGFYGYEVEGDYGGYENSHDQNLGRFEGLGFRGKNEGNDVPSAYGEFGDDVGPLMVLMMKLGYSRGFPMRTRGQASPKPMGTRVPYNVDPRMNVHSGKVTIWGIPGCLMVLNDRYYGNCILPSMVDYLGLFRVPLLIPYYLGEFKVTERVKVVFSQFDYYEEVWCNVFSLNYGHMSLDADWFARHQVLNVQNWPNVVRDQWENRLITYLLSKPQREMLTYFNPIYDERQKIERSKRVQGGNSKVEKGEDMWSEVRGLPPNRANIGYLSISKDICVGTNMASEGEQCQKEVAVQACGRPSPQEKESTQDLKGKIANSYTLLHVNDNCVTSNPLNVSSSLLIYEFNNSLPLVDDVHIMSLDTLVDPIDDEIDSSCKINLCPPSVEAYMLNGSTSSWVIGVDQLVCENYPPLEYVCDVLNRTQVSEVFENVGQQSGSEPEISSWGNLVFGASSKLDINHLEHEELVCSKSVREVDHTLFRCNVLFEDDLNTSNKASGENDGMACLGSYSLYANPLWCDNIPLKDRNLFLEDESTLRSKECVVVEATSSFTLCDFIVESTHGYYWETSREYTYEGTLVEVDLSDTFLYSLFALDNMYAIIESTDSRSNPFQEREDVTSEMAVLAFDGIIQSHYVKNQDLVPWRKRDHTWLGKVILSIGLGKANIVLCLKTVDLEGLETNNEREILPHVLVYAMNGIHDFRTMRVTASIKAKAIHVLIDTGSTYNFLDYNIARKFGRLLTVISPFGVSVADG